MGTGADVKARACCREFGATAKRIRGSAANTMGQRSTNKVGLL